MLGIRLFGIVSTQRLVALALFGLAPACSSELPKSPDLRSAKDLENSQGPSNPVLQDQPKDNGDATVPGTPNDATSDVKDNLVPIFFAEGRMGRTMLSCDAGRTWIGDQSHDDTVRCFENNLDCDHNPYYGSGAVIINHKIFTSWGHDQGGDINRSEDGITWENVSAKTPLRALAAMGSTLFGGGPNIISADLGQTWTKLNPVGLQLGQFRSAYTIPLNDTVRLFAFGDGQGVYSDDSGKNWSPITMNACNAGNFAYGNDVILLLSSTYAVCRSTDHGLSFTAVPTALNFKNILWVKDQFYGYGDGTLRKSSDGVNWTSTPADAIASALTPLVYSPDTNSFVGVRQGWASWYEKQVFYYSADGVKWTAVDSSKAKGGHPILRIVPGKIQANQACPVPP